MRLKDLREVLETGGLSPKPSKERDFAALHTVDKTERVPQANNVVDTAAAKTLAGGAAPGERERPEQGTSTLQPFTAFIGKQTEPNRGDKRQGDLKPHGAPSRAVGIAEDTQNPARHWIKTALKTIADGLAGQNGITFENNKSLAVTPQQARMLLNVMNDISADRADKMAERMQRGPVEFMRVLDFASTLH